MSRSILLGLNIDHAATLRQARYREHASTCGGMVEPDPVMLAQLAESSGADGITVHLREDRRHIQERDVVRLRECIATRLNLEMACTEEMMDFAAKVRPDAVCLVPESREEVTTEGGLDVVGHADAIAKIVPIMKERGVVLSLFIDPDPQQIQAAAKIGAPCVELHTGAFATAFSRQDYQQQWEALLDSARLAHELGLLVNAGHGINYHNIRLIRSLPHLHELNIGHSILARSMLTGIAEAVSEMKRRMAG